jgi:hypothetical protein
MSTELVHPATGEVIRLSAATSVLAEQLESIRMLENRLRDAKALISDEVLARMDREGVWTAHLDGLTIKGSSPGSVEYDAQGLWQDLQDFRTANPGVLSEEAVARAVAPVTVYKASARGVAALAKLGGELAAIVRSNSRPASKPRRVTVT